MQNDDHEPHFELRGGRSRSHSSPAGAAGFLSRFFRPHQQKQQQQPQPHHHRSHRHQQDESPPPPHHHTKEKEKINPNPDNDHVHDIPPKPTKPPPPSTKKRTNPFFRPRPPKPKQKKPSSNVGSGSNTNKKRSPGSRVSAAGSAKPSKQKTRLTLDIKPLLDSNPSFPRISFQHRSSGLPSSRVEQFVREELKAQRISSVQDGFIKLYDASGKRLEPGDQIPSTRSSKPITIWYRLSSSSDDNNKWTFSTSIRTDEGDRLNKMIEEGATVGELRKAIAGFLDVREPRRIRLYADDGIFHGFLLGEGWVLREMGKTWLTRYLAIHIRPRDGWVEAKLKGWGNDAAGRKYIIHPSAGDKTWAVRDLKVNLITTGLVNIQQQQRKRTKLSRKALLSGREGGLKMRLEGRRTSDSEAVIWTQSYDFEFSSAEDAEIFAGEESWLLKPTETCDICVEDKRATEFPVTVASRACKGHNPPLCKDCLAKWLSESIQSSGNWRRLKCPDTDCSALLSHHDVKRHAEPEVFDRYDRWLLRGALQDMKGFVQCVTVGCEYGCIVPDQEACPVFNCRMCRGSHCIRHNVAHPGESCKEYRRRQRERKEQEEASEREVKGMTKDCPKCGRRVNKTAGCNHITCHCGHEWCYVCTASYFHAQGTGLLLCRHNEGCTEGPLPGAELFNDDGTLRDPNGQQVPPRPFFHRPVLPVNIPDVPGAEWLFPHLQRRNRQPPGAGAAAAREEPPLRPPGPEPGARDPPMMTGANPGLVRPDPPPWAPGGVRPRMRGPGVDGGRRARF